MIAPLLKPKDAEGRSKLNPYQWGKQRQRLCERAGESCERCFRPTALNEGHGHHGSRRGLGGGKRNDALSNLEWLCENCHIAEHQAAERKG